MLKNRIIPCLDVKNGRVVKGINFVDLVDAGDPVEQAKIYDEQGADELCFLDITASNENRNIILDTVKKTAEKCFMPLTVGGGIRTLEDIRNLDEPLPGQAIGRPGLALNDSRRVSEDRLGAEERLRSTAGVGGATSDDRSKSYIEFDKDPFTGKAVQKTVVIKTRISRKGETVLREID